MSCIKRLSVLTVLLMVSLVNTLDVKDFNFLHNLIKENADDMAPAPIFQQWISQLLEFYDVVTASDDYKRRLKIQHEKGGAFRSGEGTEAEILEKI